MVTTIEKFMGIDLHTNRFNYHMISDKGETRSSVFEINEESLHQFYHHIDKNTNLMLEASANSSTKRDTLFTRSSRERIKRMNLDTAVCIQIDLLFDHVDILEKTKHRIEEEMKLAASCYYKEIEILTSMSGISILTAIVLIADIADIKRFSNAKKLSSYLRSSPKIDSSNETVKTRGTNKCGRKHSLSMLAQSCNHFIKTNDRLNRWYNKKLGTKKAGSLRMAILRNVIVEIYHMLRKQEYHWYRKEACHSRKMREYNSFLKKHGL